MIIQSKQSKPKLLLLHHRVLYLQGAGGYLLLLRHCPIYVRWYPPPHVSSSSGYLLLLRHCPIYVRCPVYVRCDNVQEVTCSYLANSPRSIYTYTCILLLMYPPSQVTGSYLANSPLRYDGQRGRDCVLWRRIHYEEEDTCYVYMLQRRLRLCSVEEDTL